MKTNDKLVREGCRLVGSEKMLPEFTLEILNLWQCLQASGKRIPLVFGRVGETVKHDCRQCIIFPNDIVSLATTGKSEATKRQ